jgi:hypothetical protein
LNAKVNRQNARTNLYNAQIYGAKTGLENVLNAGNTIERATPDVPWIIGNTLLQEQPEIGHYPW